MFLKFDLIMVRFLVSYFAVILHVLALETGPECHTGRQFVSILKCCNSLVFTSWKGEKMTINQICLENKMSKSIQALVVYFITCKAKV